MADFCRQCSKELFDSDKNDMSGGITEDQFVKENLCTIGICEGCGGGEFDHLGNCLGGCMNNEHKIKADT